MRNATSMESSGTSPAGSSADLQDARRAFIDLERIEEQGQIVKRLERASRGLRELLSALRGLGEQLQGRLARRDEDLREQEALAISEDMFNEMLLDENSPDRPGRK
jgi:hypothetical protein